MLIYLIARDEMKRGQITHKQGPKMRFYEVTQQTDLREHAIKIWEQTKIRSTL